MSNTPYDAEYYKGAQFSNVGTFTYEDNRKNSEFNFQITQNFMQSLGCRFQNLLDVGASGGFFLRNAVEHGINAYGQELSEWAVANSCLTGAYKHRLTAETVAEVRNGLESYKFGFDKFDCITSWFVMEHIPRPALEEVLNDLAEMSEFMVFRVPLLNIYETQAERAGYDPDPTHVNVWGFDEWRKFLWDETDWYLINAHYTDFAVEGGPGPVATFFCTSNEHLYAGTLNEGSESLLEMFPHGTPAQSLYTKEV